MISYDINATKSAFLNLSTAIPAVRPYIVAMEGLPLGPQPFYQNDTWDPFGKLPDVEAALNIVQNHCFIAQIELLDGLSAFVEQLAKAVGTSANPGPVLNDFNSVLTVVNDLSSTGASPTQQQRQTVKTGLEDLQSRLSSMVEVLNSTK